MNQVYYQRVDGLEI